MAALGSEGYPKDLEALLEGVKMSDGRTIHLIRERDLIEHDLKQGYVTAEAVARDYAPASMEEGSHR